MRDHEKDKAFLDFMKVKEFTIERSSLYENVTFDPSKRQEEQPVIMQNIRRRIGIIELQSYSALGLSWIYADKDNYSAALNEIETAAPNFAGGYYHSKYLFLTGEYEKAAKYLEDILSEGKGIVDGMLVQGEMAQHREDNETDAWEVINDVFVKVRGNNPYFFVKRGSRMNVQGRGSYEAPFKNSVDTDKLRGNILPAGNYRVINEGSSYVNIVQHTADGYLYTSSKNPDTTINDRFYFEGGKIYELTEEVIVEFSSFVEYEEYKKKQN